MVEYDVGIIQLYAYIQNKVYKQIKKDQSLIYLQKEMHERSVSEEINIFLKLIVVLRDVALCRLLHQ